MELNAQQQEKIAGAVQEAGMRAIVSLTPREFEPVIAIDIGSIGRKWEWIGRIAFIGPGAEGVLQKSIQDVIRG
jgi:hypothetical protein